MSPPKHNILRQKGNCNPMNQRRSLGIYRELIVISTIVKPTDTMVDVGQLLG